MSMQAPNSKGRRGRTRYFLNPQIIILVTKVQTSQKNMYVRKTKSVMLTIH